MKSEKLKINIVYNVCYQILLLILPLATAPYISRILGAESVGIFSYSQALANYFWLFGMLGVSNYGNRTIAKVRENKNELSKTFWEIWTFQVVIALIISVFYMAYIFRTVTEYKSVYLLQTFYVVSAAVDVSWFCFGMEKFKQTVTRTSIIKILNVIFIFLFVKGKQDLPIYTFIIGGGILATQLILWPFVLKNVEWIKPDFKGIMRHVKDNILLFIPVLAVSFYNIMDKVMLGLFSTTKEVGYYSYAEKIVQIPNTLILAFGNVMMPRISNLVSKGKKNQGIVLMDKMMFIAMFLSVAFSFGLSSIALEFAPWFYGNEFIRCGYFIKLLCPIIIFKGWAGVIRLQYIIPNNKNRVFITSLIVGAIVNFIINILLIPQYEGYGAVIGTVFAELSVCIIQFWMTRNEINFRAYLKDGIVFLVIGVIMYCLLFCFISDTTLYMSLIKKVVFGAIIYIILSGVYIWYIGKRKRLK